MELELAAGIAKLFQSYGVNIGLIAVFISYLFLDLRQRNKNAAADRLVLTNHLSGMIKDNAESNKQLAVSLNGLTAAVGNFQSRCGQIQGALQNEVDRLQKG